MIGWLIRRTIDYIVPDELFEDIINHLKEVASQ